MVRAAATVEGLTSVVVRWGHLPARLVTERGRATARLVEIITPLRPIVVTA